MTNYDVMSSGMLSAAASLGMILLWDVDGGLTQIDKYLYSSEDYIKVHIGHFSVILFVLLSDNNMVMPQPFQGEPLKIPLSHPSFHSCIEMYRVPTQVWKKI